MAKYKVASESISTDHVGYSCHQNSGNNSCTALDLMKKNIDGDNWDKTGIWLSLVCLVHCLGVPLLTLLIPTLEYLPEHETFFHTLVLLTIIPLALTSFIRGFRVHGKTLAGTLGACGIALLLLAFAYEESTLHSIITSIGGVVLVIAHWTNLRHLHQRE